MLRQTLPSGLCPARQGTARAQRTQTQPLQTRLQKCQRLASSPQSPLSGPHHRDAAHVLLSRHRLCPASPFLSQQPATSNSTSNSSEQQTTTAAKQGRACVVWIVSELVLKFSFIAQTRTVMVGDETVTRHPAQDITASAMCLVVLVAVVVQSLKLLNQVWKRGSVIRVIVHAALTNLPHSLWKICHTHTGKQTGKQTDRHTQTHTHTQTNL